VFLAIDSLLDYVVVFCHDSWDDLCLGPCWFGLGAERYGFGMFFFSVFLCGPGNVWAGQSLSLSLSELGFFW